MNGFIVAPGEVIKEYLIERNLSQKEVAAAIDTSEKHLSNLLNGKTRLTGNMAVKLERVMPDIPASFWLEYEARYQEYLARLQIEYDLENVDLQDIAKRFHFKEVFKKSKRTLLEQAAEMLEILDVRSFQDFRMAVPAGMEFMQDGGEDESVVVWIKLCEEAVSEQNKPLDNVPYDPDLLVGSLDRLKSIALNPDVNDSIRSCRKLLNRCGVYFVDLPAIANSKIRGVLATYEERPAIFISRRFKTHDHVWFAIVHELAHLLLHYDPDKIFLSDIELSSSNENDTEANKFARSFFVGAGEYEAFIASNDFSHQAVRAFARDEDVHPGVVVGFLQHDGVIPPDALNNLKVSCK